jgi:hypothetical protein
MVGRRTVLSYVAAEFTDLHWASWNRANTFLCFFL